MNLISKISLIISALSLATLVLARIFIGGWISYFWWPLGFFLVGLVVSVILDFKTYWKFLTMRTARNGMNLGLSILIMVMILSSLSYLVLLWDKEFDMTEEKIHSLSSQTTKVLDSMEDSLEAIIFYKGQEGARFRYPIQDRFKTFQRYKKDFKVEFVDAYKKNKLAKIYLESQSDRDSQDVFVFLEYKDRRVRVDSPWDEEKILSAIIKASSRSEQNVYFTSGHGEKNFFSKGAEGLEGFRTALENSSFNVSEWSFIEEKAGLPDDAQALLIIGPTQPFFEQEIKWLNEYIENDGKVFIALDPGKNHNLSAFVEKKLGVKFKNNFVGSMGLKAILKNETSVLGFRYSADSPITQSFTKMGRAISFFDEASEIEKSSSIPSGWKFEELVYSDPSSYVLDSLNSTVSNQKLEPRVLAVSIDEFPMDKNPQEEQKEEASSQKGFKAVVFGDSDFLTNKSFTKGVHKDLALNIVASLSDQGHLVSIRPKKLKSTKLILTTSSRYIIVVFVIFLPLVFCFLAGFLWWRRKQS